MKLLLLTFGLLALAVAGIAIKIWAKKDGKFAGTCASQNPTLNETGESFGFCGEGEAKDFIADGNIGPHGRLPNNTHGGLLSEAYIHGVNNIVEAARLIRGESVNQPKKNIDHALVSSGVGVPTGALILGKD